MAGPIFKLAIVRGLREAYYQLTEEQKQALQQKAFAVGPAYGGTALLSCNSRWCDESIFGWGIYQYPDIQAVQKETAELERIEWYRYVDTQTFLGVQVEGVPVGSFDAPAAVYHLAIIRNLANESLATVSEEDRTRRMAGVNKSLEECGGKTLIVCDIEWSNAESTMFLVQSFPSIEAQQKHIKDCHKLGLYRYVNSREVMGTRM